MTWNKKVQNLLSALCKVISTKSKSKKRGRKFPDSYFAEISSEICKISKNQCSNFSKIDCLTYSRNAWALIGNLKFLNLFVLVKKVSKTKNNNIVLDTHMQSAFLLIFCCKSMYYILEISWGWNQNFSQDSKTNVTNVFH